MCVYIIYLWIVTHTPQVVALTLLTAVPLLNLYHAFPVVFNCSTEEAKLPFIIR